MKHGKIPEKLIIAILSEEVGLMQLITFETV